MKFELEKCLSSLAEKRPVFHSEADFQFSLAWEIQQQYQEAEIRLEYPFEFENNVNNYIDIVVFSDDKVIPIELKYKTKESKFLVECEEYTLKYQAAQPQVKYDCLKDVQRIESFSQKYNSSRYKFFKGYTIWLFSDLSYCNYSKRIGICRDFTIHEGAIKHGVMDWDDKASDGSKRKREIPINLMGTYEIKWKNYSKLILTEDENRDKVLEFKYAILEIDKVSFGEKIEQVQ